jgi:hypothetical protein
MTLLSLKYPVSQKYRIHLLRAGCGLIAKFGLNNNMNKSYEFKQGVQARVNGADYFHDCPYFVSTWERRQWQEGFGYAAGKLAPIELQLSQAKAALIDEQ